MDMQITGRRALYEAFDPYETGQLDVGDGHTLYWELSGNPEGKPVVFLHGGPGGGSSPEHRRQFDPDRYKMLVFDQRGCGKSTPYASLDANTTWHLVDDIEKLRTEVAKVDKWMVFGGSWGSTLSLAYAQTYPDRVTELVLRGIFLFDQYEVDWLYKEGADSVYPDKWDEFISLIPEDERGNLVEAYRKRLTSGTAEEQLPAAKAWSAWEAATVTVLPSEETVEHFTSPEIAVAIARIENHYMANGGWLEEGQLLRGAEKIRHIPGVIVQGRHDTCTPPKAAWALKKAWPEVELNIVPDGGHLYNEPGILDGLIRATDRFASQ
ncbi:prolyl aminopeptidase [Sphingomonas sp. SE220]|uniref:Proline iminopeptidase n=2 Tax=Sphingomonas hankyongi TaxID=2908209 RepID=A0ABT0S1Z1_9SPHN|nr:prolyl aminopeptidase [Sphingomonas hankyongi]MCL6729862.1 prolyl aminopeptidase [Sphingomonas hankyongi]